MKKQGPYILLLLLFASTARAYYQSEQGRWLSRDPIGEQGGINVYAYLNNDALGKIDPFGLRSAACSKDSLGYTIAGADYVERLEVEGRMFSRGEVQKMLNLFEKLTGVLDKLMNEAGLAGKAYKGYYTKQIDLVQKQLDGLNEKMMEAGPLIFEIDYKCKTCVCDEKKGYHWEQERKTRTWTCGAAGLPTAAEGIISGKWIYFGMDHEQEISKCRGKFLEKARSLSLCGD